jgi:hypothetical protein
MESDTAGWAGTVHEFLVAEEQHWINALERFVSEQLYLPIGAAQVRAWQDTFRKLQNVLEKVRSAHPQAAHWGLAFEYELPRERGRRPDLVILTNGPILVIEFKRRRTALQADVDQVAAYARDLANYHSGCRDRAVIPILFPTNAQSNVVAVVDHVHVVDVEGLLSLLRSVGAECVLAEQPSYPRVLLEGDYAPLPTLVHAARLIFEHEPLPRIRRAESAGIPQALHVLNTIAKQAQRDGQRHLALVTGVPGAGKTLVGLQFVYSMQSVNGVHGAGQRSAVFLSGNDPLVKVLQHALKSTIFVQDVHGFLKSYGGMSRRLPEERIWVYDEAQRAWDAERVKEKRNHPFSEPDDFVRLAQRAPDGTMLVGLIGEGQEIHLGEESGLVQWNDALRRFGADGWTVHSPPRIADVFTAAQLQANEALDLTTTLRSHLAADLHRWVSELLEGRIAASAAISNGMALAHYNIYVSRDRETLVAYARQRYAEQRDKRYGLLISSKARTLKEYGFDSPFGATRTWIGPWYNDEPSSPLSCCQLGRAATEFSCQGLELDFPIVGWGEDLVWSDRGWLSKNSNRSSARDPHRLRLNSYRVLLTRGRDGMGIFVPPPLDTTFRALVAAGAREL